MDLVHSKQLLGNEYGENGFAFKSLRRLRKPVVIQGDGGYINYIPSDKTDISCGLQRDDCASIGNSQLLYYIIIKRGFRFDIGNSILLSFWSAQECTAIIKLNKNI